MARAAVAGRKRAGTTLANLVKVAESPDTNCHQGITTDGVYFYGLHTDTLYKFDASWNVLATNPNAATQVGVGHCADGQYYDGKIYIAAEDYSSESVFSNMRIAIFSAADLSFVTYHDISAQGHEASSLCIDPVLGIIYVTDYTAGTYLYKYSLDDFSYLGRVKLERSAYHAQGISIYNGDLWIARGTPYFELQRVSPDGRLLETRTLTGITGDLEGIDITTGTLYAVDDQGATEPVFTYKFVDPLRRAIPNFSLSSSLNLSGSTYVTTSYTLPPSGTIFCRFNPKRLYNFLSIFDSSNNADMWECWINASGVISFRTGATGGTRVGDYTLNNPVGKWHSVCVTWQQGGSATMYINGVQVGLVQSTNSATSGANFYWGGGNAGNIKGEMLLCDGRVYEAALTAQQALSLHNAGIDPTSPAIKQLMDQGSGSTLTDTSGNGRNGTITNPAWSTNTPITSRVMATARTEVG